MELQFRERSYSKYVPKEPEPIPDMSSLTMDEVFELYQKLPDWDRFPMPDVFYTHYNVKKPKPADIMETLTYQPPPSDSQRSVEKRGPVPGGIREVPDLPPLEIKTEFTPDENDDEHHEEMQIRWEDSIKPIEPKSQELANLMKSNLHEHDADPNTVASELARDA